MSRDTDTRAVTLVDIPLVRRLTDQATVLDSEIEYTRDIGGPNGALLSSILLPQRGLHTLVARSAKQQVVGQFRIRPDDHNAQIVYIAPELHDGESDTVWLHILDAMTREAGRHNVHALVAEVEERSCLFETMRASGFAVYARQQIWRRKPGSYAQTEPPVKLQAQTDADVTGISSLIANTVPPLMQQITLPNDDLPGWVYRRQDRIEAYVAVVEGKQGYYLIPYIHPDISLQTSAILASVIRGLNRTDRLPIYIRVRRYQDWIGAALEALQFEPGPRQAVMVRHIAAGVRQSNFKTVAEELAAVVTPAKPPTSS